MKNASAALAPICDQLVSTAVNMEELASSARCGDSKALVHSLAALQSGLNCQQEVARNMAVHTFNPERRYFNIILFRLT